MAGSILACYHWLVTGEPLASFRLRCLRGLFGLDCLNKGAQLRYEPEGYSDILAFIVLGIHPADGGPHRTALEPHS
jgi:hypothetical protein